MTQWIPECHMADKEKTDNPTYKTTGGYLKTYGYKEAWGNAYNSVSREDQLEIKNILHFEPVIFHEISGIWIDGEPCQHSDKMNYCSNCGAKLK